MITFYKDPIKREKNRLYMAEYRKKHPNYFKELYRKNRKHHLKLQKIRRNKRTPEKKSEWYRNHRKQNNEYDRKSRKKRREQLYEKIGRKCVLCENTEKIAKICFHEKYGKKHKHYLKYYKKHYEDFLPLCNKHHRMLHWLYEVDINKVLELLKNMQSNF